MSKKDGMLFSNALFGYRKEDVNDYIKRSDISHADQISLLQSENERLSERAKAAEAQVEELESLLSKIENEYALQIERITREFELKLQKAVTEKENKRSKGARISIFGRGKKK